MNLNKRQRVFIFVALVITVVAVFAAVFLLSERHSPEEEENVDTILQTIPPADLQETESSKTGSYRRGGSGEYNSLPAEEEGSPDVAPSSPDGRGFSATGPRDSRNPGPVVVDDLFGEYKDAPADPPAPKKRSEGRAASSSRPPAPEPPVQEEPTPEEKDASSSASEPVRQVKRSGAISSLDEDVSTDLGNGFSTLDGTDRWVEASSGKPYRCMFIRDEKARTGQRITVRLLEDLVVGGVHIPKNTHLQGVCKITDRMEVSITSLDMGGRIVTLGFEAYDTDGGKGIYCSDLSEVRKEVTEQGLATATSGLGSRLGRTARDVAAVGASIVRNKAGEATVSVPAGYTFYLMEEKQ